MTHRQHVARTAKKPGLVAVAKRGLTSPSRANSTKKLDSESQATGFCNSFFDGKAGLLTLSLSLCGFLLAAAAGADKKTEKQKDDDTRKIVETVLLREATAPVDRRAELAAALEQQPDSNLLRWQSGFVRDAQSWQPFGQAIRSTDEEEKLARYRRRRDRTPLTAADQLELANWCHQNGMPEQERAHLSAVVTLAPDQDHSAVLARLGYWRIGNQWLDREQLAGWSEWNRRTLAAIKQWGPKLEKIAEQLHGTPRQRSAALASLNQLTDPATIPAIEYALCGRDNITAAQGVATIQRMPEYEATLALARQAAFAKDPGIRQQATEALKTRPFEEFVPDLIGLMATPAASGFDGRLSLWRDRRGSAFVLQYSYIIARETEDQFQVTALNTVDFRLNEQLRGTVGTVRGLGMNTLNVAIQRSQNDVGRSLAAEAYQREKQLEAVNERTAELNERISNVLGTISTRDPGSDPRAWWQWWGNYTDTQRIGDKRVVRVEEDGIRGDPTTRFANRCECFVAGTPIWTMSGTVPIEQIKIGDRVLAQDPDSGELAYKPVIYTSVRQAKELVRLQIAGEDITATGGHRLWVSGTGWVKARDLQPAARLHTVTGNTSLTSVATGPVAPTYNLVVDGFHTYFVGRAGILVQDLPLPQPTNSVVPGLSRRQFLSSAAP